MLGSLLRARTLVLIFAVLAVTTTTLAESPSQTRKAPPDRSPGLEPASTAPIIAPDELVVDLELVYGDDPPVTVSVRHGSLARYANSVHGYRLGIVPEVVDHLSGEVDLWLIDLEGEGMNLLPGQHRETLRGTVGFSSITANESSIPMEIKVIAIQVAPDSTGIHSLDASLLEAISIGEADSPEFLMTDTWGCCTTCNGVLVCGCNNGTSCGGCNQGC